MMEQFENNDKDYIKYLKKFANTEIVFVDQIQFDSLYFEQAKYLNDIFTENIVIKGKFYCTAKLTQKGFDKICSNDMFFSLKIRLLKFFNLI